MFSKSRLITIAMTLAVIALAVQTDKGREILTGDGGFFG